MAPDPNYTRYSDAFDEARTSILRHEPFDRLVAIDAKLGKTPAIMKDYYVLVDFWLMAAKALEQAGENPLPAVEKAFERLNWMQNGTSSHQMALWALQKCSNDMQFPRLMKLVRERLEMRLRAQAAMQPVNRPGGGSGQSTRRQMRY
jgi:hypothetical protein